jgi:hypothetical protein
MIFRLLNTAILASVLFLVSVIAFAIYEKAPNDADLERDIATIRNDLGLVEKESSKYEGGLIKTMLELERRTLEITAQMLEQKRASLLHRIWLEYRVEGPHLATPASSERLSAIQQDIANAEQKVQASRSEAAKYSGGLVQTMALAAAATEQFSVAMLRLKYFSEKYGMGINLPAAAPGGATTPDSPKRPPGKAVPDKEAL